jgi:hypothetical protein
MRDQYKVLTEKYELVLEADTEQLATPQGREIKGVFVPTEIENWINDVLQIPNYVRKKQAPKERIRKQIDGKRYDVTNNYTDDQNKYNGWTFVGVKKANDYTVKELSFIVNKIYKTYGHIKEAENLNEIRKSIINELNNIRSDEKTLNQYNKGDLSRYILQHMIPKALERSRPSKKYQKGLPFFYNTYNPTKQQKEQIAAYIKSIWPVNNICPATKITLIPALLTGKGNSGPPPSSPSLDKIIPALGYVKGNVAVISVLANGIKNDGTYKELELLYNYTKKGKEVIKEVKNINNGYTGTVNNPKLSNRPRKLQEVLRGAWRRAKEQKVPLPDFKEDYLMNLLPLDMKCPVFGITMKWNYESSKYDSPALDKIVPALGYVQGNVIFISERANRMKNNGTPEQIIGVYEWMKAHHAEPDPQATG